MNNSVALVACSGLLTLAGCVADPAADGDQEDVATAEAALSPGNAALTITNGTDTDYCATVTVTNGLDEPTARWRVVLDLATSVVYSVQNGTLSQLTGIASATPVSETTVVAPGGRTSFSFCATRTASAVVPAVLAWNMESNAYATCPTNSGLHPTKAALAVAIAREIGEWDPLNDLTVDANGMTVVSPAGLARCANGCKNVVGILGQQDSAIATFVDQNIFDPYLLRADLSEAFQRQRNLINDLVLRDPEALPPAHKLTMVAGPTNLGKGSCGPHYIFQVDNTDGTPLTSDQAANMVNSLCFFGYGSCGENAYIGFTQTSTGCPTDRICIAIDPTDGDNSSESTTSAGSAPSYPMNRVYDPTNTRLGTQCITTLGVLGTLLSMCEEIPGTCGYLYCVE